MARVLILDDEEYKREFIKYIISDIPGIEEIYDTSSGKEAIAIAQEKHPHIILLDIFLADQSITGLDVARVIRQYMDRSLIVFITRYPEYALEAFDIHPYAYVSKPIRISHFINLIEEMLRKVQQQNQLKSDIFIVKSKDSIVHITKSDIIFIESDNHKSSIHTKDSVWGVRKGLSEFEQVLGPEFLRVHRSFIVNMNRIARTREIFDRSYEISFKNYDKKALMSRNYYHKYRDYFRV